MTNKEEVVEKWRKDFATLLEISSHTPMLQKLTRAVKLTAFPQVGLKEHADSDDAVNDDIVNRALLGLKNKKQQTQMGYQHHLLSKPLPILFETYVYPFSVATWNYCSNPKE